MGVRRAWSSASAAHVITQRMAAAQGGSHGVGRREGRGEWWCGRWAPHSSVVVALAAICALTLGGCGVALGGGSASGVSGQSLNTLPWCDQPLISFVDGSKPTQAPITDWNAVKNDLGFTPYLPASLPQGSCLDLVGGSVHDPIFGGHLSVTWVLPKTGPLSFSEAPKRNVTAGAPQCAEAQAIPSATPGSAATPSATTTTPPDAGAAAATTICIGAQSDTAVTIAAHLPASQVRAYFDHLQPNVNWAPTGPSPVPVATATAASAATATGGQ